MKISIDEFRSRLFLEIQTKYNLLANGDLIIHNLTKVDDQRSYACMIQNQIDNQTKQSRFKTLHVRGRRRGNSCSLWKWISFSDRSPFGPELSVLNNTNYHARSGDVIELPCGIASLSSHARISWWKNGIEMTNLAETIYQNSLIVHVSSHTEMYTCQVDDESSGRMTSMMTLTVTGKWLIA